MRIFSYHLATTSPATTLRAMCRPPTRHTSPGLHHAECMATMALGAPILSPERMQLRSLAVFASWESEAALEDFLSFSELGSTLYSGWHVRLRFLRRWGNVPEFDGLPEGDGKTDPALPVVAVTLARLKLPQALRFIRWGRPVEKLVRDHPATTMALAALRPLRTFSTFSVWRSQREMTDMVRGHGSSPDAAHHAGAMAERERKDFHHGFATYRFRAISEHGQWDGRSRMVPEGS
ncbi:hypothetical protein HZ994_00430 [Akkermansiaceae bacterium]|nr:hypothetical protein HZ994_00430 [Akkermansiaceae bacterium]